MLTKAGINESLYSGKDTVINVGIDELFRFSTKLMTVSDIYYNYHLKTSFNTIKVNTNDSKQQIFIGFEVLDSNGLRVTNIGVNGFIDLLSYNELASVYNDWMIDYFEFGEIPTNFLESDPITDIKGGYVPKNGEYDDNKYAEDNMFICQFKTKMNLILQPVMSSLGFSVTYKCIDVVTSSSYKMNSQYTKDNVDDQTITYEYPDILGYPAGENYSCPFDTRYFSPKFYSDYFKTSAISSGSKISGQTDTIYYVLEHATHSNKITASNSSTSGNITTTVTHYACDYCNYTNKITTTEEIDTGGSGSGGSGSVCAHDGGVYYVTNDLSASGVWEASHMPNYTADSIKGTHSVRCKKCKAWLRDEAHSWKIGGDIGTCISQGGGYVRCKCDVWSTDYNFTGDSEKDFNMDNHADPVRQYKAPTCTEYGYDYIICKACGWDESWSGKNIFIEPLGHDWGDWNVIADATCTQAGSQTHTCDRYDRSEEESIPALGHNWGDWITTIDATCQKQGEKVRYCETCGEDDTQTVTGSHSWTYIPKTKKYQCEYCGIISNNSGNNSNLWY